MKQLVFALLLVGCSAPAAHHFGASLDSGPVAAPFGSAYVFSSKAAAQACASTVDTALHMPIAGVNVGDSGVYATAAQSVTLTYYVPLQNPNTGLWSYLADGVTQPLLARSATALSLPAPVALDATWYAAGDAGIVTAEAGIADSGLHPYFPEHWRP